MTTILFLTHSKGYCHPERSEGPAFHRPRRKQVLRCAQDDKGN